MSKWWSNPWLRVAVLQPVLYVAPLVAICLLLAVLPGSDLGYVAWGLYLIPVSAVWSLISTLIAVFRSNRTIGDRVVFAALGLVGNGAALAAGLYGLLLAAIIACHGGYECPF